MNFDNTQAIKNFDLNRVGDSIGNLPKQLLNVYKRSLQVKLPKSYRQIDNLAYCGMGGSNLASELLAHVYAQQLKVPLLLIRDYDLPSCIGPKSLVIACSYSGSTEETVSCLQQAIARKAKIIGISAGGEIEKTCMARHLPFIKLDYSLNPSRQPRYDVGSQLGAALAIFENLKLIKPAKVLSAASKLNKLGEHLESKCRTPRNPSKKLAKKLKDRNIYLVGSQFLSANAHILANQINESAKQLAVPYLISELNHHLLEALENPRPTVKETRFVFIISPDYSETIRRRIKVTQKILDQKKIPHFSIIAEGESELDQALSVLAIGSWTSYYLALLNNQNPANIPWVDYFKKELRKKQR